jgi:hypothetical protein
MRAVASFAVLLLLLALAYEFAGWSEKRAIEIVAEEAARKSHTIRAMSTGFRLPPAYLGRRKAHQGIYVDDTRYNLQISKGGLRVLTIPEGATEDGDRELRNFAVFESDEAVGLLGNALAAVEVNTVVVVASHAFVGPRPGDYPERRERIGMLLRGLGATSSPFVLITVRRPRGFVPIAEAYSTTRGLVLAVHLERDLTVYDEREPLRVLDERATVALELEEAQGEKFDVVNRSLDGQAFPAIQLSVPPQEPRGVRWDVAELLASADPTGEREAATFTTDVALLWDWRSGLNGARCTLLVNGRERGERVIFREGGETMQWLAWEVLLRTDREVLESVEIRVEALAEPKGPRARVLLANPALQLGRVTSGRS